MGDSAMMEEKSSIEAWKAEAEENMKALADIHKLAKLSEDLKGYESYDAESSWDAFSSTLNGFDEAGDVGDDTIVEITERDMKEPAKVFAINRWIKVAAACAVIIAGVFTIYTPATVDNTFVSAEYNSVDAIKSVILDEGTEITMDRNTKLRSTSNRSVNLKGKAHFSVVSNLDNPFTVYMPVGEILVTGTTFTVNATNKATDIYLEEGSVTFILGDRKYIMQVGDLLRVSDGHVEIVKLNDDNYNSWLDNKLVFDDNTLLEVVESLSRHFGKKVELEDANAFRNCNVKTKFSDYELEDILNEFQTTHGLQYEIREGKYIVTSSQC